jgi:hypothetical protein
MNSARQDGWKADASSHGEAHHKLGGLAPSNVAVSITSAMESCQEEGDLPLLAQILLPGCFARGMQLG